MLPAHCQREVNRQPPSARDFAYGSSGLQDCSRCAARSYLGGRVFPSRECSSPWSLSATPERFGAGAMRHSPCGKYPVRPRLRACSLIPQSRSHGVFFLGVVARLQGF